MKAYHEVCADIIIMLEELGKSLGDITQEADLPESQSKIAEATDILLEEEFEAILKKITTKL